MATYTPMIEQYLSIKAEYQDAFLFFRLGDFYEMFFQDAEDAVLILEITLTSREGGSEQRIPMCGVPYHSAEGYITKLIENGHKVAICEQVEDPKVAVGVVKREVVRVITPGTVMDGKLLETNENNYLAAITCDIEKHLFGISFSDISTGEFYAAEIFGGINNVISELNQFQPAEIIMDTSINKRFQSELRQIKATFSFIEQEENSKDEFIAITSSQFVQADLSKQSDIIMHSSGLLLKYLHKTQLRKLNHINYLQVYDAKQFMILDQFSKRNLELTHTSREQTKKGSLVWLLDETKTAMGSRLLRRWLEKPLLSPNMINQRLNAVEVFYNDPLLTDELTNLLKQIYDIERLIAKISFGNANPRDIFNLRKSLEIIPEIYQLIDKNKASSLTNYIKNMDLCQDLAMIIAEAIQDEPPLMLKAGGIIKRGYNKQLDEYYLATSEGKTWIYELEQREKSLTNIKSLKVGFNKVFGYYIEVTKSNMALVPNDRYIRKQTLANAERYITEELKDKETIILEAEENIQELEHQLFIAIRDTIADHNPRLQTLAQQISQLDVLSSFAVISSKYRYSKPTINQEGVIKIDASRHPVIEAVHQEKPFIPNDILLNQVSDQILLITGPNMAGKSTYMRQLALSVIMAQMGCFVPAKKANIGIIDRIFTRIGAGDDLTSGQSTFMVEMLETKQAITEATPNSLILLDEIGRGTSTYDGMALAQAIVQYIHERVQAKTLFATHYHELTSLAGKFSRIQNIHVNVIEKDGKLIFLHKIEKGRADRSYGIHVAELAGMPKEVIDNAKNLLKELEAKSINSGQNQLKFNLFNDTADNSLKEPSHIQKPKDDKQIALYGQLIKRIEALDLLNMSPMEGFQVLYDIHKQLRK